MNKKVSVILTALLSLLIFQLAQADDIKVNLIHPYFIGAEFAGLSNNLSSESLTLGLQTRHDEYRLVDLDVKSGNNGRIARSKNGTSKLLTYQSLKEGENYKNKEDFIARKETVETLKDYLNELAKQTSKPQIIVSRPPLSRYCEAFGKYAAFGYNFVFCFRDGGMRVWRLAANYTGHGNIEVSKEISIANLISKNYPDTYTAPITAVAFGELSQTAVSVFALDTTGRLIIIELTLYNMDTSGIVAVRKEGKVRIHHLSSVLNPFTVGKNRVEQLKKDPKSVLSNWAKNELLLSPDKVEKYSSDDFGKVVRHAYVQAIYPKSGFESLMKKSSSISLADAAKEKFEFCAWYGYNNFNAYDDQCFKVEDTSIKQSEYIVAFHYRSNVNGTSYVYRVDHVGDEENFHHKMNQPNSKYEFSVVTPPNDIIEYDDGKCNKIVTLYDSYYTIHAPKEHLDHKPNSEGFIEGLNFHINAAMAVGQIFYFFSDPNTLRVVRGKLEENCTVLKLDLNNAYKTDAQNFLLQDPSGRLPKLTDNLVFDKYSGISAEGSNSSMVIIIVAVIVSILIIAGIVYMFCLRAVADEDLGRTRKSKIVVKTPASSGHKHSTKPATKSETSNKPNQWDNIHAQTVRSAQSAVGSGTGPKSKIHSILKSTKADSTKREHSAGQKSIKSHHSHKMTPSSPSKSHNLNQKSAPKSPLSLVRKSIKSPLTSTKSKASIKSTKSAKSMGATRSPRSNLPRSPGTAPKSLIRKT